MTSRVWRRPPWFCWCDAAMVLLGCIPLALAPSRVAAQLRYPFLPAMETVPDARSAGLARAFTAVAEGPSAVWWNPGSLGLSSTWSAQLVTDLDRVTWIGSKDLDVYALAGHIRGAGVAAHVLRLGEEESGRGVRRVWDALVHVGVGLDLSRHAGLGSPERMRWGIGAAAKYYAIAQRDEPIDRGYRDRAGALDADLGSLMIVRRPLVRGAAGDFFASGGPPAPYAGLRAGFVLRNAFNREVDLTERKGGEVFLGRQVRAGVALEAGTASWRSVGPIAAGTLSAEMIGDIDDVRSSPTRAFGFELALLRVIALRYGEIRDEASRLRGVSRGLGLCLGLPWRAGIRLDWADAASPKGRILRPMMPAGRAEQLSVSIWFQPGRPSGAGGVR